MDFAALVVFLILYYVRPQEWIGFIAGLKPVKWSIVFALITMLLRERGFQPRDLLRTPHDWMMLAYLLWIVFSNDSPAQTFFDCYNLFVFYIVTVQALANARRIQAFLGWWAFMIMVVAGMAVAAEYGFDPLDSSTLTHGRMQGRLVLNTSIFNNPNALGHSVYPAAFLVYFLLVWKRPVFMKIAALPVIFLPLYCVYMTVSKGAFIGVFVTTVAGLSFGRPKLVQLWVLAASATLGWALLWTMPRMTELSDTSKDEAIQGRVAAFRFGLHTLKTETTGVGLFKFVDGVERMFGFKKAAHSSYVQVGGELGWPGLFLFVGILYCCVRTLFNAKTTDETEERCRRILYVLLVSYALSSWMVNWPWRATFFLMVAACAAFHRLMLAKAQLPVTVPASEAVPDPMRPLPVLPAPAEPAASEPATGNADASSPAAKKEKKLSPLAADHTAAEPVGLRWNRLRWVDLVLMGVLTWITIRFWEYLITKM